MAGNCREKRATFIVRLSKVKSESVFLTGVINVPRTENQRVAINGGVWTGDFGISGWVVTVSARWCSP